MKLYMILPLAVSAVRHRIRARKLRSQNFDLTLLNNREDNPYGIYYVKDGEDVERPRSSE
jgi:hypothetical protein